MSDLQAGLDWTVWKYPLPEGETRWELDDLPLSANVVMVGHQDGAPMLWVKLRPEQRERHPRVFQIFGTGELAPSHSHHVGSFQAVDVFGSDLVFHVFEVGR